MAQINIRQTICQGGTPFKITTHVDPFFANLI